ncbi:peptidoglycan-binding protein [Actinomadura sp. KC06]|uniref:peptidoglycan-binding domain-containing protein n=1 Tax=Actinomadura sp. KC06 TaxID=2530369 RepID=UPI0014052C23|nr:peptidoglycan-binding protein [Actinomadura sp. KC06]
MTAPPFKPPKLSYPPMMSGPRVQQWQQQMKTRSWNIVPDGKFGPISRRTCANFQTEKGLEPDGVVDAATWKATWEAPPADPPPAPEEDLVHGSEGEHVRTWERQANRRGWRIKNIDGHYDDEDVRVCKQMQHALGLPKTGVVDFDTWNATWWENVPTTV